MKTVSHNYTNEFIKNTHINNNKNETNSAYVKGNIIEGKILSKNSTDTNILLNEKEFTFPRNSVYGNEGDNVSFEIVKSTNNKLVLKQILEKSQNVEIKDCKQISISNIKDLFKKGNLIKEDDKNNDYEDDQIKEAIAIAQIKRNLSYGSKNINKNIINQLVAKGINLDKIDISLLKSVITESKFTRKNSDEILKEFEEYLNSNKNTNEEKSKIAKELIENNINPSDKNIEIFNNFFNKINDLKNLSEDDIVSILKSETDLNLKNIMFFKSNTKFKKTKDNTYDEFDKHLKKLFFDNDIEYNEENIKTAKLFFDNGIEISKDNFLKNDFLKNLDQNYLTKEVVNGIREETNLYDLDLYKLYSINRKYKNNLIATSKIENINIDNIKGFLNDNKLLILKNLFSYKNNYEKNTKFNEEIESNSIALKKMLANFQLKLTSEANYRLAEKNIEIDTLPIKNLLIELEHLEKEKYIENLKVSGVEISDTNIEKMHFSFKKINEIKLNNKIYADLINNKINFSIDELHENRIYNIDEYENFITRPNAKYGDSFENIIKDVPEYLKSLSLSKTDENIKAIYILNKNNIDATEENIIKISNIDLKIDSLLKKFQPNIVAKLIDDGYEPTKMNIDHILEYIENYEEVYGISKTEKIANAIYEMDKHSDFDKDTRDGIVAIYKMINHIGKNNSACLGKIIDSNIDVTLDNLFALSKTINKKGVLLDKTIDTDFGELENTNFNENSIKNKIETAIKNKEKEISKDKLIKIEEILNKSNNAKTVANLDFLNNINLSDVNIFNKFSKGINNNLKLDYIIENLVVDNLKDSSETLKNLSLDNIFQKIKENENVDDKLLDLQNNFFKTNSDFFKEINPDSIKYLKDNKIKTTIKNISLMDKLNKNPDIVVSNLDKINDVRFNSDILSKDYISDLQNSIDYIICDDISLQEETKQLLSINDLLNKSELNNKYEIPIKINDKITNLKMYVLNDNLLNKKETEISLNLKTNNLGNLKINLKINDGNIDLQFFTEEKNSLTNLKNNIGFFKDEIKKENYNLNDINFF